MTNIYVIQDRVSGAFGSIFESPNDETVKRDFVNMVSNPSIPDYAVSDTVVIYLGFFNEDEKNPSISSAGLPRIVFRGDDNEIRKMREKISFETSSGSC